MSNNRTEQERALRVQCAKCPWKKGVNPYDIPGGYDVRKHRSLASTIATPGMFGGSAIRKMACHETTGGAEQSCVGWLAQQLGPGNNIGLRLEVAMGKENGNIRTVGPQHERFEDTLPRSRKGGA